MLVRFQIFIVYVIGSINLDILIYRLLTFYLENIHNFIHPRYSVYFLEKETLIFFQM